MEESAKLEVRVQVIETKLDSVAAKVEQLAASVDERFDGVDQRFDGVDQRFDGVDQRFEAVDQRFDAVDRRFDAVDRRFDALEAAIVEQREYTDFAFTQLDHKIDAGFAQWDDRFSRFERKLDQFIDVQVRTNDLVERRLRALESPKP